MNLISEGRISVYFISWLQPRLIGKMWHGDISDITLFIFVIFVILVIFLILVFKSCTMGKVLCGQEPHEKSLLISLVWTGIKVVGVVLPTVFISTENCNELCIFLALQECTLGRGTFFSQYAKTGLFTIRVTRFMFFWVNYPLITSEMFPHLTLSICWLPTVLHIWIISQQIFHSLALRS